MTQVINEKPIPGQLKYENYREQFKRLNKALANGFNLEAMFIEYAIMEDRTESVLHHANLWDVYIKSLRGHSITINSKIRYIKKRAENRTDLLQKYFSDDLLDRILEWKDERNRLIHALLKQELEHNEVSKLAEQGNVLVKLLRNRSSSYNRAIDKKNAKVKSDN